MTTLVVVASNTTVVTATAADALIECNLLNGWSFINVLFDKLKSHENIQKVSKRLKNFCIFVFQKKKKNFFFDFF